MGAVGDCQPYRVRRRRPISLAREKSHAHHNRHATVLGQDRGGLGHPVPAITARLARGGVMRITVGGCWVAVVAEYQLVEAVLEQWSSS